MSDYRFSPTVWFEKDQVSIWLPELSLDAIGETFENALELMISEILDYVTDWETLRKAPNHAKNEPWVQLILADMSPSRVRAQLLAL